MEREGRGSHIASLVYTLFAYRDGRDIDSVKYPLVAQQYVPNGMNAGLTIGVAQDSRSLVPPFPGPNRNLSPSSGRQRHLAALAGLFVQVLQLRQRAGLVKLGHVALDGTKLRANASKHKAMRNGRMAEAEQRLTGGVEALLAQVAARYAREASSTGRGGPATSGRRNWRGVRADW